MGISLIGVLMLAQSLNLNDIARAQGSARTGFNRGSFDLNVLNGAVKANSRGMWFILLQPVAFMTYLISAMAETNRTPFDMPEAEGELVSGYHIEYGAMRFGAFFLAEYINMITGQRHRQLLLPGRLAVAHALPERRGLEPIWFIIKMSFFIFIYYWLRWTLPRVRYDQVMGLTWKVLLPLVLVNILVVSVLKAAMLYVFDNPPPFSLGDDRPIVAVAAVRRGRDCSSSCWFCLAGSRLATSSYTGKSERPIPGRQPAPGDVAAAAPRPSRDRQASRWRARREMCNVMREEILHGEV